MPYFSDIYRSSETNRLGFTFCAPVKAGFLQAAFCMDQGVAFQDPNEAWIAYRRYYDHIEQKDW
jgi:hypothetical protein